MNCKLWETAKDENDRLLLIKCNALKEENQRERERLVREFVLK